MMSLMFLDDGAFFCKDFETALLDSDHVRKDLIRSGAVYSIKKSKWHPSQKMEFLGLVWDSEKGILSAADHRIEKIINMCQLLLSYSQCPVKKLASFVGQVISLIPVVSKCARLTPKRSQFHIACSPSWDSHITMSEDILFKIKFWLKSIRSLNCREICNDGPPRVFNLIEGDASATGCGSILNNDLEYGSSKKIFQ